MAQLRIGRQDDRIGPAELARFRCNRVRDRQQSRPRGGAGREPYRGGDRRKKDLGVEFDAGFEARFPLDYDLKGVIGGQAGLLLPGGALENADGVRLPPQWIAIGRLGLLF